MKVWIKRLVLIAVVVVGGKLAWDQRARIVPISNNHFKIQGAWYRWEFNHKGLDAYVFKDRVIMKDGLEWGSYLLRSSVEIEVTFDGRARDYVLSFPNDDTMIWSTDTGEGLITAMDWRR